MSTSPTQQAKMEQYFTEFISNEPDHESLDEMIEALDDVIYKVLLEKLGYINSSDDQKTLVRQKMRDYMMNMDFNSPSLAHAEKMLRAIGVSDFKKAAKYLDQLYVDRSKAISQAQRLNAQKPRNKDPFAALLARIVSQTPDISSEDAIERLESGLYDDVITAFDHEEISYLLPDGREKTVSKSNIPSRLSRLRNKK